MSLFSCHEFIEKNNFTFYDIERNEQLSYLCFIGSPWCPKRKISYDMSDILVRLSKDYNKYDKDTLCVVKFKTINEYFVPYDYLIWDSLNTPKTGIFALIPLRKTIILFEELNSRA